MMETIDFRKIPARQRVAHYGLLFALAAADGSFDREEMLALSDVLELEGLDVEDRERVRAFVVTPPALADCLAIIQDAGDELRQGTMLSLVDLACSDGVLTEAEEKALTEIRAQLGVGPEQLEAMLAFIDELGGCDFQRDPTEAELRALVARAEALIASGVAPGAVCFSATAGRIFRLGPEAWRDALVLALGQVPGTPISIVIGAQVAISVSEVLRGMESGDEEQRARRLIRRERLQDGIEHLQTTIDEVTQAIDSRRRAGGGDEEIAALEARRAGLVQLVRTRRSALEDA